MNLQGNTSKSSTQLEDFEVFDLRDGLNVVAYSVMSSSKYDYIFFIFGNQMKSIIMKLQFYIADVHTPGFT